MPRKKFINRDDEQITMSDEELQTDLHNTGDSLDDEEEQVDTEDNAITKAQLQDAGRDLCLHYFNLAKERRLNNEPQVLPAVVQLYQAVMRE